MVLVEKKPLVNARDVRICLPHFRQNVSFPHPQMPPTTTAEARFLLWAYAFRGSTFQKLGAMGVGTPGLCPQTAWGPSSVLR